MRFHEGSRPIGVYWNFKSAVSSPCFLFSSRSLTTLLDELATLNRKQNRGCFLLAKNQSPFLLSSSFLCIHSPRRGKRKKKLSNSQENLMIYNECLFVCVFSSVPLSSPCILQLHISKCRHLLYFILC